MSVGQAHLKSLGELRAEVEAGTRQKRYGPICDDCGGMCGPLWQLTISNFPEEPCLMCGALTDSLHSFEKVPEFDKRKAVR